MTTAKPRHTSKVRGAGPSRKKNYRDVDDRYFRKHLSDLVRDHGGEWIIIADGKLIGIGNKEDISDLVSKARKSHPQSTPFIAPIPTEDELECAL